MHAFQYSTRPGPRASEYSIPCESCERMRSAKGSPQLWRVVASLDRWREGHAGDAKRGAMLRRGSIHRGCRNTWPDESEESGPWRSGPCTCSKTSRGVTTPGSISSAPHGCTSTQRERAMREGIAVVSGKTQKSGTPIPPRAPALARELQYARSDEPGASPRRPRHPLSQGKPWRLFKTAPIVHQGSGSRPKATKSHKRFLGRAERGTP